MNRIVFFMLLLIIPLSLLASEIQHILGGAAEILFFGISILVVCCVLLPLAYYRLRTKFLAVVLYIIGGILSVMGIALGLIANGTMVVQGMIFMLVGALIIRLPIKRKPL